MLPFSSECPLTFLISGASGQDGRIAAEMLQACGQRVVGLQRSGRATPLQPYPIQEWIEWDWRSVEDLEGHLSAVQPDVFLHLAAHHHAATSSPQDRLADERMMFETNLAGGHKILTALQGAVPQCKFIAALSSQMYSASEPGEPINESSPLDPSSYYGVTKVGMWEAIKHHRKAGHVNGGGAILFNHESRYRSSRFVTRYISQGVAAIKAGRQRVLPLRNTGAVADWCAAQDAVRGMLLMAAQENVGDYIISSGEGTPLADLLDYAFSAVDLSWENYVEAESHTTAPYVVGNNGLAREALNWQPELTMEAVIADMVKYDCQ